MSNLQENKGGIVDGKLHSECDEDGCGEKFTITGTDQMVELEEGEAVIVPEAFSPMCFSDSFCKNPANYKMKGTIKQIASALNQLGGGVNFKSGAKVWKNGRVMNTPKLTVKNSRRNPDNIKGGSIIINRTNMNNPEVMTFEGTAHEIASQINSYGGHGVEIKEHGGSIEYPEKETRYVVDIDAYIWAINDEEAKKKASELSEQIDSEHYPEVRHLTEQPHGTMFSRKLFKTGGEITISKKELSELGKHIETHIKAIKKYISYQKLKAKKNYPQKSQSIDIATMVYRSDREGDLIDMFKQRELLIDWAKDPKNKVKFIVAFSGGKDSVAMVLYLLFERNINPKDIELWHHEVDGNGDNLWDWKCTPEYCRKFAEAVGVQILFSYRKGGIQREIYKNNEWKQDVYYQSEQDGEYHVARSSKNEKHRKTKMMFPAISSSLLTRWCSSDVKIDVMKVAINGIEKYKNLNAIICTGERRYESSNRAKYLEIEPYNFAQNREIIQWRPVIDLSEQQVWKLFEKWKIQPHPAYELGWGRCSCQICIFSSPNHWASNNVISPEKIKKIAQTEQEIGNMLLNKPIKEMQQQPDGKTKMVEKLGKDGKPLMQNIYESSVNVGKSFIDPNSELTAKWIKQATVSFTEPIFVTGKWKLPEGAYKGDDCGAN